MKYIGVFLLLCSMSFACTDEEVQKTKAYQELKVKYLQAQLQLEQLQGTVAQLQNSQHEANFNKVLEQLGDEGAKLCASAPNTRFNRATLKCDPLPNAPSEVKKEEKTKGK